MIKRLMPADRTSPLAETHRTLVPLNFEKHLKIVLIELTNGSLVSSYPIVTSPLVSNLSRKTQRLICTTTPELGPRNFLSSYGACSETRLKSWDEKSWIYFAVVIDFFSRKVVGYAIGESMETWLICKALQMAYDRRGMPTDIIHHSDRGVQYASEQYRSLLTKFDFTQSMSRKGNCYDNAIVESFFHTLKVEHVYRYDFENLDQAKRSIVDYIENFYNKKRSHSSLNFLSPIDFERGLMAA